MKKPFVAVICHYFLIVTCAVLCWPALSSGAAVSGQDLVLFYTSDNHGETEPCGCEANQLGGLGRRSFQFQRIAVESGQPRLVVDAGDLLFKHLAIPAGLEMQESMMAEAIVEAYSLVGYDAVCVGSRDLIAGVGLLRKVAPQGKFTWLSANLVDKSTGGPIFAATVRRQIGEVKATLIGLTGPATLAPADNAELLSWEKVLPPLLTEVSKTTDLVILLSNLPAAENRRIAEAYDSIHILIQSASGDGGAISASPVHNTVIASTRPQGKDIGVMNITWQSSKRWGCPPAEVLAQKKSVLDGVIWQLSKYQTGTQDPESTLSDQPDRLKAYRVLVSRERELRDEIQELILCDPAAESPEGNPSTYRNRFFTLDSSLPDQRDVVEVSDRLDRALNQLGRELAKTQVEVDSNYLGSARCTSCHAEQAAAWQKTPHASAYVTLVNKDQQFNVNCLPCHVTGVGMDRASEALSIAEVRRGVGCETCHGAGRKHTQDPMGNSMIRKPEASVCLSCHAPPHDESFDYERNIKMVH